MVGESAARQGKTGAFIARVLSPLALLGLLAQPAHAAPFAAYLPLALAPLDEPIEGSYSALTSYPFTRPLVLGGIRAYQRFMSPLRASSCPMAPSCSRFGYQAFDAHNPIKAWLLTTDRLHRCSHDLGWYPKLIDEEGTTRSADPVPKPTPGGAPGQSRLGYTLETPEPLPTAGDLPARDAKDADDARLLRFADELASQDALQEAAVEYRRLLSYYSDSPLRPRAAIGLVTCYRRTGRHLEAIHWGEKTLATEELRSDQRSDIAFGIAASFVNLQNGHRARTILAELAEHGPRPLRYRAALLRGFSFAREERWGEAEQTFDGVQEQGEAAVRAHRLAALARQGPALPRKNPTTAGLLGIVPGLGYAYAGFPQTALASLVVNGLFFAGTYKAFKDGNTGLGTMLGIMSLGWYGGNVYGSIASAQRRNNRAREEFLLTFELGFRY